MPPAVVLKSLSCSQHP
jgi:hypothetical protein